VEEGNVPTQTPMPSKNLKKYILGDDELAISTSEDEQQNILDNIFKMDEDKGDINRGKEVTKDMQISPDESLEFNDS
jgi:hypothetical protein